MSATKYIRHKAGVARYWLGVCWFKGTAPIHRFWSFSLWLWAVTKGVTKACYQAMHNKLYYGILYLHWFHPMKLGVYRQYSPRAARVERFPVLLETVAQLPSIAIVTPSYNQAAYVGQTIESVISQNYPSLQYAVLDGGSTDGSREIIESWRARLTYAVSERDKGQADAIFKGFGKVQGEIMAYLNSDDRLMPGALHFVGDYFASHPEVDVIYGHRVVINAEGAEIGRWVLPDHCEKTLRQMDFIPQETLFWRRSIYEKIGGIDPSFRFAMDWDLLLRFTNAGAVFHRLPYFLAYFRAHDDQKSQTIFGSVGEEECRKLMEREHGGELDKKKRELVHLRYSRKAVICALLMDFGIRR